MQVSNAQLIEIVKIFVIGFDLKDLFDIYIDFYKKKSN